VEGEVAARAVERLLELSSDADARLRVATAKLCISAGKESALPTLLDWLDDSGYDLALPEITFVYQEAYRASLAILARSAEEPPVSFEEPPKPVAGPWDED
jgi:hypothetical protein